MRGAKTVGGEGWLKEARQSRDKPSQHAIDLADLGDDEDEDEGYV